MSDANLQDPEGLPKAYVLSAIPEVRQRSAKLGTLSLGIRAFSRRKVMILAAPAVAFLAAFLVLSLQPPVYRATAALIIQPPRFATEFKPDPLSIETYRTIMLSSYMVSKLRTALIEQKVFPETVRQKEIADMLTVGIYSNQEVDRLGARAFMPVLDLNVEARAPQQASETANLWARLAVQESAAVFGTAKVATLDFVENQYPMVVTKLNQLGKESKDTTDRFNQELVELETGWLQAIVKKRRDNLNREVLFSGENERNILDFEKETARLIQAHLEETERLRQQFLVENQPSLPKAELELLKTRLSVLQDDLRETDLAIKTSRDALEKIKVQMEGQPQFLVLSKAITDEALWNSVGKERSGVMPQALADLKLQSQSINPSYQTLLDKLIATQIEYQTLVPRKGHLEKELEQLETEIEGLEKRISRIDLELFNLVERRELDLEILRKGQAVELKNLRAKKAADYSSLVEQGKNELALLELRYKDALDAKRRERDLTVGEIERKRKSSEKIVALFSEKHESAQLARQESGSDVQIGAPAVMPGEEEPRGTLLYAVLALAVVAVVTSFLAVAWEYVRVEMGLDAPSGAASPVVGGHAETHQIGSGARHREVASR